MTFEGVFETGAKLNGYLNEILNAYLSRIRLEKLDKMVSRVEQELPQLKKSVDTLKSYPCFTKYVPTDFC